MRALRTEHSRLPPVSVLERSHSEEQDVERVHDARDVGAVVAELHGILGNEVVASVIAGAGVGGRQMEADARPVQVSGTRTDGPYGWNYGSEVTEFPHGVTEVRIKVHFQPGAGVTPADLARVEADARVGVNQYYNFQHTVTSSCTIETALVCRRGASTAGTSRTGYG